MGSFLDLWHDGYTWGIGGGVNVCVQVRRAYLYAQSSVSLQLTTASGLSVSLGSWVVFSWLIVKHTSLHTSSCNVNNRGLMESWVVLQSSREVTWLFSGDYWSCWFPHLLPCKTDHQWLLSKYIEETCIEDRRYFILRIDYPVLPSFVKRKFVLTCVWFYIWIILD